MSPLIPFCIAATAVLLGYGRGRRLAAHPPLMRSADPRPRALAEAIASGVTVLVVGWILASAIAPAPAFVAPAFTMLAIAICVTQFRKTMRIRRI